MCVGESNWVSGRAEVHRVIYGIIGVLEYD